MKIIQITGIGYNKDSNLYALTDTGDIYILRNVNAEDSKKIKAKKLKVKL